jgi:hypothetical protein
MSRDESKEAKKQLDELIKKGKVQPSRSGSAAPTLFVSKADGSKRWCMDLRLLNDVTLPDANQAPLQETAKEKLQGKRYFTKLDMRDGYHHLRIKEGDEHKTAFLTEFGLYEWKVMCFGLRNAPAEFARYMNENLHDFINDFVAVYFDDIIIFSDDLETHWKHVRTVLERLREKKINFKLKKCTFAETEVPYLGHIIDGNTTKMQQEKLKAILEWPTPTKIKEIEGFRGLAGYYRQYIEKYSDRMRPLNERIKTRTFSWEKEEEEAFKEIKEKFKENQILILFDYEKQIWIFTDASNYAIGAVICQMDDKGKLRPVTFYSRKLLPAEMNYSTSDKELLAIVQTLKKFRHYLQGTKFPVIVKSDHQNLKTFTTTKILNGRQARWAEELSAYDFRIEHVKGKENTVADALSRRPDYQTNEEEKEQESILKETEGTLRINTARMVSMEANQNALLEEIKERVSEYHGRDDLTQDEMGFMRFKGLVFVPKELEEKVIKEHHDGIEHGHPGIARTMEKVQRNYYFAGMYRKIKRYTTNCESCNKNKYTHQRPQGKMNTEGRKATKPWEIITADFVEMPPTKSTLYKGILNAILIIVDTFSKYAVLIATRKDANTDEIYHLMWERIFAVFGIPEEAISDRDKIFRTEKWNTLMKGVGITQLLSTAHHQQTDGQSERKIQELQAYYRHYLSYDQENWLEILPAAQLALNDVVSTSSGTTPNFVLYGTRSQENRDTTHEQQMKAIHKQIQLDLAWSHARTKEYYDKKRSDAPDLQEGSYVFLRRRTIGKSEYNIKTKRYSEKLDSIHLGPFKVLKKLPYDNYALELPKRMRIHPEFHISLLKPIAERDKTPTVEEYEVEKIAGRRTNSEGETEYLVKWQGYDENENTWEKTTNLHCPELVRAFEGTTDPKKSRRRRVHSKPARQRQ